VLQSCDAETAIFIRDSSAGYDPKPEGMPLGVFQRLQRQSEFAVPGIDLANVERVIHQQGGRAWVEGLLDGGVIFYFSIPKQTQVSISARWGEYPMAATVFPC